MKKGSLAIFGLSAVSLLLLGAGCYKNTNTSSNTTQNLNVAASNRTTTNTSNLNANTNRTTNTSNLNTTATNTSGATTIEIQSFAFAPATLTVPVGTTVTWTNNDSVGHTVTGDQGGPSSTTFASGQTYSYTFTTAGNFPYHCATHPSMTGSVIVTP